MRRFLAVWPQNHSDSFHRFGLKTSGDDFWRFGLKTCCDGFWRVGLKTTQTVFTGLTSKLVVTISGDLASKPAATISGGLTSKPTVTVFSGFAPKLVVTVSLSLTLKLVVSFLVEPQNQGGGGFPGLGLKTGSFSLMIWALKSLRRFLSLDLKTKWASICRLRHKIDGGRSARDTRRDLAACFA
jgi:hypothetical protein